MGVRDVMRASSGLAEQSRVVIQRADFDPGQQMEILRAGHAAAGAICSFVGTVRDRNERHAAGSVEAIELEHYPGMTEASIERMIAETLERFDVLQSRVVHRIGRLEVGERIVFVAVLARHRHAAFQACEFLMDYLKTQAPFWKREYLPDGDSHWVAARQTDDQALARWGVRSKNA